MRKTHEEVRAEPHYVYRLLGKRGRVLYVGCSLAPDNRIAVHRTNARMGHLIGKVEKFGPYPFEEAREIEAAWIREIQPPFNIEHTEREQRGLPAYRRRLVTG